MRGSRSGSDGEVRFASADCSRVFLRLPERENHIEGGGKKKLPPAISRKSIILIGNMSIVFPGQPLGSSSKQGAGVYTDDNGAARASLIGIFKDKVCDLSSANRSACRPNPFQRP
jgi:hypothetical protein